ncbi:MAG: CDP-alcohol phosphatidyltransferase family protein [Simkaniaceae bacterium]
MNQVLTLSNGLSLLRGPLALLLFVQNVKIRILSLFLAMLTDALDGFLARRFRATTRVGAVLDPLMDKLFVLIALSIYLVDGKLVLWQALAMISRDFFLCLFGLYLRLTNQWKDYRCRAILWGKVITALQFFVLIALTLNVNLPSLLFSLFILLGLLAFIELFQVIRSSRQKSKSIE